MVEAGWYHRCVDARYMNKTTDGRNLYDNHGLRVLALMFLRYGTRDIVDPHSYYSAPLPSLKTGSPKYAWLNMSSCFLLEEFGLAN